MSNNDFSTYLKKKILIVVSVGLLLSCLGVTAIGIWPLYNQLKTQQYDRLFFAVKTRTMLIEQFLEKARETAKQITSRSKAREALEKYNAHNINLLDYQKFSAPILRDAINLSAFAVGITRLDIYGKPALQIGVPIPVSFLQISNAIDTEPAFSGPITIGNEMFIVVSAPIINRDKKHVGTDVVLFTVSTLRDIVQNYTGLGATGETVLGRYTPDEKAELFFKLRFEKQSKIKSLQLQNLAVAQQARNNISEFAEKRTVELLNNTDELAAYGFIKSVDWIIIVRMTKEELFATVTRKVLTNVLIIILLVIPLFLIGLVLLLRPLSDRILIHVETLQREISAKENATRKLELAEKNLQDEKEQLSVTLSSIGDGVIATDLDARIVLINKVAEHLTGWSKQQAIGQPLDKVFNIVNGKTDDPCDNLVYKVVASEKTIELDDDAVLINKGGVKYRVADSCAPIRNETGDLLGVIIVFRDMTEQYKTEEALRRSQKMDAIGQISGGIAHDFNNQLAVIIGYLDFLHESTANDKKLHEWVETARRATMRCIDLTRQLLAFTRNHSKEKKRVNLNTIFKELETMIARSITPAIEIEYRLSDTLWLTEIDPGDFQDVILNLVINARDAMPDGGKLLIETTNKMLDANATALNPDVRPGDFVQLMLSDTGVGMDKAIQEHIFEPFYTTKPKGKGTGLGMSMVYGFVKRSSGFINVYSEKNVGTTLRLYFPHAVATEDDVVKKHITEEEPPLGSETILIVDDEVDLLHLADQYLTDLGYRTYLAENASQALAILAKEKGIDLLFSDVVMPGSMNGYELAQQATEQKMDLKVLLTSGFTSKTIFQTGQQQFSMRLLDKPYRKIDLAKRIRQTLDGKKLS
ncbi:MAG: response regulator [Gammaproteobacteria bacterium]|nr:response regulator [Gammaproteobacteria bacterium]